MNNEIVEQFAEALHDIWSNWFMYQHKHSTKKNIFKWMNQSITKYKDLSEEDKQKDRDLFKSRLAPLLKGYQRHFITIVDKPIDIEDIVALHINEAKRLNMHGLEYINWLRFKDHQEEIAEKELDNNQD